MKNFMLLLVLFLPMVSQAQSNSISWFTVASGGGTSTGGVYTVNATIGQAVAGGPITGGNYAITTGFWSLIQVVQTAGAPTLIITHIGNQAIVSWDPSATGWTLQTNNSLAVGTWGNYLGAVVNNSVTNAPPTGNVYFRLKQ
jgi:hypothetical protein